MSPIVLRSRVGADGILRVEIPMGSAEAERQMQVTIESIPPDDVDESEYVQWLDRISGRWQGEFERLPVGDFESRDLF